MKEQLRQLALIARPWVVILLVTSAAAWINAGRAGIEILPSISPASDNAEQAQAQLEKLLPEGIASVKIAQINEAIRSGSYILLDARVKTEFQKGHIPGALNLPISGFQEAFFTLNPPLERSKSYIIYCDGGECAASIELAEILKQMGFEKVAVFLGGWAEWQKQGVK